MLQDAYRGLIFDNLVSKRHSTFRQQSGMNRAFGQNVIPISETS